jgi:alkanesulfonate monooxygenase SsuD/methylene tetrahydromethanopterin reductase-like flavin-dependent oxidoreductase (luciferase family)
VSPASFRHPSILARTVATVSHISGGRIELGIGAGWHEGEHRQHGFPFLPTAERVAMLVEAIEIVRRSWEGEQFSFTGECYRLVEAHPLPQPVGKVNVIVGGSGTSATIEPAVQFADEYNTAFISPSVARRRRSAVDEACARGGRGPLTFSVALGCVVGEDRSAFERRAERLADVLGGDPVVPGMEHGVYGTVAEVADQLREYERAGADRVMLQQLIPGDVDMVYLIGRDLIPRLS